jgi:NAD(P)-dependent dehydrogenase (short-subunit alcohol dehydrogenase family)
MVDRLIGKRIFVTGAAQGIGLAIAQCFAREGAALFLIDTDGALLEKEALSLRESGAKVGFAQADISDAKYRLMRKSDKLMHWSIMPVSTFSANRWRWTMKHGAVVLTLISKVRGIVVRLCCHG